MTKNDLIIEVMNFLDYFHYHNKNLTKEQWQKIRDLKDFVYEQKKQTVKIIKQRKPKQSEK